MTVDRAKGHGRAATPSRRGPFARFVGQWAVRLTTYRRDGTPVGTAVNLAVAGDKAYFRTYEETWKFKRLARNHEVEVAPSTIRGEATGPSMHAEARALEGAEVSGRGPESMPGIVCSRGSS